MLRYLYLQNILNFAQNLLSIENVVLKSEYPYRIDHKQEMPMIFKAKFELDIFNDF